MSVFNVFCKDILFINFICYLNVNSIEIVVIIIAKQEWFSIIIQSIGYIWNTKKIVHNSFTQFAP